MTVTIWHNPRCSKSRQTLDLLRSEGVEPEIREYLKTPPGKAEIETLVEIVGGDPRELIRHGEPEFRSLRINKANLSKDDIVKALVAQPILLQRPIVVVGRQAAIGRPPEAVLPLLK